MAAQAGQLPCIKWLVEKASIPVRLRATDGATPAHFAAANGEVNLMGLSLSIFLTLNAIRILSRLCAWNGFWTTEDQHLIKTIQEGH